MLTAYNKLCNITCKGETVLNFGGNYAHCGLTFSFLRSSSLIKYRRHLLFCDFCLIVFMLFSNIMEDF